MGGFQNQLLNQTFKQRFYDIIITALIRGCKQMVEDCSEHRSSIQNHEEKIRTHLLENYLEDSDAKGTGKIITPLNVSALTEQNP